MIEILIMIENVVNTFTDYVAIIHKLKYLAIGLCNFGQLNKIMKDFDQFLKNRSKERLK